LPYGRAAATAELNLARAGTRRKRKPLTAAQKKAISQAMKAAWKKRKASDKKTAE